MKSKVLVTGSSGFIGKNLIGFLKEKKEFSIVTASRDNPKLDDDTKNHFQISSIGSSTDWSKPLKGVDLVIHLAGIAHRSGTREEYEEINENEFDSRLRNTEKRLWELLYIGPQDEQSIADSNQYLIPKNKENAFINAIDAAAALTSICLKVSVRALFGKWSEANTRDIMNAINFNKNTPVLSSENLHQNIINYNPTIINNTQKVFAAFKTEQTLNVPGTEED